MKMLLTVQVETGGEGKHDQCSPHCPWLSTASPQHGMRCMLFTSWQGTVPFTYLNGTGIRPADRCLGCISAEQRGRILL
jgi:hypothetical protein